MNRRGRREHEDFRETHGGQTKARGANRHLPTVTDFGRVIAKSPPASGPPSGSPSWNFGTRAESRLSKIHHGEGIPATPRPNVRY